jgi:hypothetical protein
LLQNTENSTGQLLIGNNANGTQPWHGSIEEIAIFNQNSADATGGLPAAQPLIHYTFDTIEKDTVPNKANTTYTLQVPKHFPPLARTMLASFPLKELGSKWLRKDILINIFGFIPLSLCFAIVIAQGRLHPWMQCITALAFCFLFSLAIEAAQAYLPSRDSSLLDLLCNTFGGGLTAAAFITWKYRE